MLVDKGSFFSQTMQPLGIETTLPAIRLPRLIIDHLSRSTVKAHSKKILAGVISGLGTSFSKEASSLGSFVSNLTTGKIAVTKQPHSFTVLLPNRKFNKLE